TRYVFLSARVSAQRNENAHCGQERLAEEVAEDLGVAVREEQSFSLLRNRVSHVSPYRSRNRLKSGSSRRSAPINFYQPPAKRFCRLDIALRWSGQTSGSRAGHCLFAE